MRLIQRFPNTSAARRARAGRICGLYAVTQDTADTSLLVAAVEAALKGGAGAIQYRNKAADLTLRRVQAAALAQLAAARGALLIVNDDPELAAAMAADGVHIGDEDGAIAAARQSVGPDCLVGVSCYNDLTRAEAAVAAGADYVAFGSFYPSTVKPGARRAEPGLLHAARALGVPVVAIGGIDAGNAALLHDAGADAVAVISAVFAAGDAHAIEAATRRIAAVFAPPRLSRNESA